MKRDKKLSTLKRMATIKEHKRVFDNFNLPPRNITVEHEGKMYVRKCWQSVNKFGWGEWKEL